MADDQRLIVLSFENPVAAQEALTAATRLSTEGKLLLRDAVFVSKDDKGKVRVLETTDPGPGRSALGGAFWGLLFGVILAVPIAGVVVGAGGAALAAKLRDTGVSDAFIKTIKDEVEAGRTDLVLLVSHVNEEAAIEELKRFKGLATFVTGNLTDEGEQHVKQALGQQA